MSIESPSFRTEACFNDVAPYLTLSAEPVPFSHTVSTHYPSFRVWITPRHLPSNFTHNRFSPSAKSYRKNRSSRGIILPSMRPGVSPI
jgi:hypothetical protein